MARSETWWKGNDVILHLKGVTAKDTQGQTTFLNAATVTARILDLQGNEVSAAGYAAQTLGYIIGSDGDYAKIADKAVIENLGNGPYYLLFEAVEGDSDYRRRVRLTIAEREV